MVKSRASIAASLNTPSPSSTITESNSPLLAVSTRKPRNQRKRPNQTYDEAAALLSTAYPNIFSSKKKTPWKYPQLLSDYDEASQLLLPFESIEDTGFLPHTSIQKKPDHFFQHKEVNSGGEIDDSRGFFDDFDAESILDEEVEEGINSFMGNIEFNDGENNRVNGECVSSVSSGGFGFAGNFNLGLGLRSSLQKSNDGNWWKFPPVELEQISPRFQITTTASAGDGQSIAVANNKNKTIATAGDKKKKKKKKKKKQKVNLPSIEAKSCENSNPKPVQRVSPLLKLNYDGVLEAWSDKESPFSDDVTINVHAIDLFGENEAREAVVSRYKEKRRNRLFSKTNIRFQIRKLNADQRPRVQGRFVRRHRETT